jgi:SAM-dependent methyltransferase
MAIPYDQEWFDELRVPGQQDRYSWLTNLLSPVESIVNFGCWSGCEPFALLWTLDAHEITVVEMEQKCLDDLDEQLQIITTHHSLAVEGREIRAVQRDMKFPIPEVQDQYFDLAYCEDVLYSVLIQGSMDAVKLAISQMIRVVKPSGFIVAVEPKFGVDFETRRSEASRIPIFVQIPKTEPLDMSELFLSNDLDLLDILDSPPYAYCCQKRS